jgi:hypothetical protein
MRQEKKMETPCQERKLLARFVPLFLVAVLLLLLAACGATPTPTPTPVPPTATPAPTPRDPINGKFDVGGYSLQVFCTGSGSVPVVFDNGLAMSDAYWAVTRSALLQKAYLCSYNRASMGASDKAPKSPRTSADMIEDMHTLLGKVGIKPPYVLVGHSLGGLNVRLYATRYPSEVGGVVLVDSTHPDELLSCGASLPPKADNEPFAVTQMRDACSDDVRRNVGYEGGVDLLTSAQQGKSAGKLGNIPLVVLSQNPKSRSDFPVGYPEELAAKDQQRHSDFQKDLLALSTRSTQLIASYSGHMIPTSEPDAVAKAIDVVLKQVNGQ